MSSISCAAGVVHRTCIGSGPRSSSAFQRTLYSRPNLVCPDKLTTRCRVSPGSNRGKKTSLFHQIPIKRFTGQLIRISARLVGNARELSFLLDTELHFHTLTLGTCGMGVNGDCKTPSALFRLP